MNGARKKNGLKGKGKRKKGNGKKNGKNKTNACNDGCLEVDVQKSQRKSSPAPSDCIHLNAHQLGRIRLHAYSVVEIVYQRSKTVIYSLTSSISVHTFNA